MTTCLYYVASMWPALLSAGLGGKKRLRAGLSFVARDPVVSLQCLGLSEPTHCSIRLEQSTVEGLLRRTLEKNTEKRPSYGQKKC